METGEKIIEKVPDVWFDWFARFIPGAAGIVTFYFFHDCEIPKDIEGWTIFLFVILSYLIGHALQPLSGILIKLIEQAVDVIFFKGKREKEYREAKAKKNLKVSLLGKVSKAHAEANSMLSIFFVFAINVYILSENSVSLLFKFLPFYFLAAAIERVFARSRKIKDLDPT